MAQGYGADSLEVFVGQCSVRCCDLLKIFFPLFAGMSSSNAKMETESDDRKKAAEATLAALESSAGRSLAVKRARMAKAKVIKEKVSSLHAPSMVPPWMPPLLLSRKLNMKEPMPSRLVPMQPQLSWLILVPSMKLIVSWLPMVGRSTLLANVFSWLW